MIDRREVLQVGAIGSALALSAPAIGRAVDPAVEPSLRRRILLDDGWRFHLGHATDPARDFGWGHNLSTYAKAGTGTDGAMPKFDDKGWEAVRVPHDWVLDLPYIKDVANPNPAARGEDPRAPHGFKAIGRAHPENSVGWYRRALDIQASDKGRAIWLEFDGVYRNCIVFVNGYVVGEEESGYTPFRVDIADFLEYGGGLNVVTVRADASLGEGWFYEGAGIYRHAHLVSAALVHVPQWGVFVRAEIDRDGARIDVSTDVANAGLGDANVKLRHIVIGPDSKTVATIDPDTIKLGAEQQMTADVTTHIRAPQLWSVETPQLYRLVTEILDGDSIIDRVETPFGIRAIAFDAERGFFLNGKNVKLLGTCNHQDHAGVGTALPDALHAWRVDQLKAMGSNAWRSAHNPPSQAFLDVCDAKGMLMIVEARRNSTDATSMSELERMVRSSRNHPCVILWSVGNEEPHQGTERGARISAEMVRRAKALDPTRPTTQAFDNGFGNGATRVVDVIGFNYRTEKIPAYHAAHPGQPIIGTETGSTVSTRGEYTTDEARHIVRAYDTEHPWWASTAEEWWSIAATHPYIAGGFIWTGFDYRGEPTPYGYWPSVSSYFGVLDLCGFPKDEFHYYRSWWNPAPMVHLLPHWNWAGREGKPIEVWAYSNADEVELFVNGKSAGRKVMPRNRHLAWEVPYAPGKVEARGYTGGRMIASDRRETVSAPTAIRLVADRRMIAADGRDVAMLRAEITDRAGRIVPTGDAPLSFAVSGAGRLIGVGNGDPVSHESDKGPKRSAFNGLAQAIVQSSGMIGAVRIVASSPGLQPGMVSILTIG